jgi:quinol monooxygenase YgiN
MYGLISQLLTRPESRDDLIQALSGGSKSMPGCLSYVVAKDGAREDAVWVTEVWDSKESHANSLKLPQVQQAIAKGRPLITGTGTRSETVPVSI